MYARALRTRYTGGAVQCRSRIRHSSAGQVTQQREFAQLLFGEREPRFSFRIELGLVPQRHRRMQERARWREPQPLNAQATTAALAVALADQALVAAPTGLAASATGT